MQPATIAYKVELAMADSEQESDSENLIPPCANDDTFQEEQDDNDVEMESSSNPFADFDWGGDDEEINTEKGPQQRGGYHPKKAEEGGAVSEGKAWENIDWEMHGASPPSILLLPLLPLTCKLSVENVAEFWEWCGQNCLAVGVALPTPLLAVSNKYPNATQISRHPSKVWPFRYQERRCGAGNVCGCGLIFKITWWGDEEDPDRMVCQVCRDSGDSWHNDHK